MPYAGEFGLTAGVKYGVEMVKEVKYGVEMVKEVKYGVEMKEVKYGRNDEGR